eukprot:scaffold16710_cov61-Attheya_sp.AAC.4
MMIIPAVLVYLLHEDALYCRDGARKHFAGLDSYVPSAYLANMYVLNVNVLDPERHHQKEDFDELADPCRELLLREGPRAVTSSYRLMESGLRKLTFDGVKVFRLATYHYCTSKAAGTEYEP